jgi:hypothetical protein
LWRTSLEAAEGILAQGYATSQNEYDWLGEGVYFFQDAPLRALEWARQRHGADAAVLQSRISLVDSMDLLDIAWFEELTVVHDEFVAAAKRAGLALPRQTSGAHRLDRDVINYLAGVLADKGIVIRSVRAAFFEGKPVYPNSAIYDRAHIQIAVRDTSAIIETEIHR